MTVQSDSLEQSLHRLVAAQSSLMGLTRRSRETPFGDLALHPDDDVFLEGVLHDLVGELDTLLGAGNDYSQQLVHIFNIERVPLEGAASVRCVKRIATVAGSAIARIRTNPPQMKKISDTSLLAIQRVCTRLHGFVRHLERSSCVTPPLVTDERSLQDLLGALLRLYADDVRSEEYSPSYAGGGSRIDFLLKDQQVAIETKIARGAAPEKKIGSELLVDQERYRAHPDCRTLLCLVYDPDELISNPYGLRNDLEKLSDSSLIVIVVFSPLR